LPADRTTHLYLYRIAQEAINNAVRHGRARNIYLQLIESDNGIVLRIEDDGVGFDPSTAGEGLGMRTMRHRALMIRGLLTIERGVESGTIISCRINAESHEHTNEKPICHVH
jgi:two-component system, LuxR family, sensor kinase FixL